MASSWETIKVGAQDLDLYVSIPAGSGPFPAVLVGPHAGGLDRFVQGVAEKLAEDGYAAVAPDLFTGIGKDTASEGSPPAQHLNDTGISAAVAGTIDFLRNHASIGQQRIGVTGFGIGGRAAWLAAATSPAFNASVPFYGGDIMAPWGDAARAPIELAGEIVCPILFHFGEDDENPTQEDMRTLDAELTRLGKRHQFFTYPGAGHAFMDPEGPRYQKGASQAAWARTMEFFTWHLKGQAVR
jgi:carboxymethylenebutenolidase